MTRLETILLYVAGAAFVVADLLNTHPVLREGSAFSVSSAHPVFPVHGLLQWLGAGLVLVATPALVARQQAVAGAFGAAATALFAIGMLFFCGWSFALGGVLPSAAAAAPAAFDDGSAFGGLAGALLGVGFPVIFLGHLAFGGVILWRRAFPRPVGLLFVLSPIVTAALSELTPAGGLALSGVALVWAGWGLSKQGS